MKKAFYLGVFLFVSLTSFSQTDTSRIEQYCQLIATPKILSNKVTIEIDFGEERSFWRGNRLKTFVGTFGKFNSIIDALNFMGKQGWIFINAYPVQYNQTEIYHFGFKKLFSKSELEDLR
jgi:hypothetical protein